MVMEKFRAGFFSNKGYSHQDSGQFDAAERCFLKALSLLKKLKNITEQKTGIAIQYSNLGLLYHQQGKINEAILNLEKAISIYINLNNIDDCAPIYASVGKAYFDAKKYYESEEALKKALSIYNKRKNAKEAISTINILLNTISERI